MVVVAISGGTGKLGRALTDALKTSTKHTVKILTRKVTPELSDEIGVPIIQVDYSEVDSLVKVLEESHIDTVISTISILGEAENIAQLNLIEAATRSSITKRFIPSEFGIIYNQEHSQQFPIVKGKLDALEKLRKSGLEYTLVSNGFFLDYYGLPKVKSYLQPLIFAIDVAHDTAAIPGSGDIPVVFTHTFDVATFVVASLDLEKWPERSIIIGDKKTWNEVVTLAEEARGTKFNISYDGLDKLKTFQVTELPSHPPVYAFRPKEQLQYVLAVFGLWTARGDFNLPEKDTLNARFPEIKPMTVAAILDRAWKSK